MDIRRKEIKKNEKGKNAQLHGEYLGKGVRNFGGNFVAGIKHA